MHCNNDTSFLRWWRKIITQKGKGHISKFCFSHAAMYNSERQPFLKKYIRKCDLSTLLEIEKKDTYKETNGPNIKLGKDILLSRNFRESIWLHPAPQHHLSMPSLCNLHSILLLYVSIVTFYTSWQKYWRVSICFE